MFKKLFILSCLVLIPLCGMAQANYTDYLQRRMAGRGTVVLHQDAELDRLVNGGSAPIQPSRSNTSGISGEVTSQEVEGVSPMPPSGRHTTANGYRIQIISLGSSAKDKAEAENWGRRFKATFSTTNANVYISFRSPHYVCRVGDFRTREEANELLQQLRATKQFGSASIVRSTINVYY